eukprot:gene32546-39352_t
MRLNVATWNVLADCYIHEKASLSVDVLCMQEVDHYEDFYTNLFESFGYGTVYMQRPSKDDGCLIAYRNDRFELRDVMRVNLDSLGYLDANAQQKGRSKFAKQNVAVLALFNERGSTKSFISATCHLHWNPHLQEVKYAQALHVLSQLQQFRQQYGNPPVIWTGDFNSLPYDDVYKLITSPASPSSPTRPMSTHPTRQSLPSHLVLPSNYARGPSARFICDNSLSRLGRWMRVLGVDVAQGEGTGADTPSGINKQKNSKQYEEWKRQSIAEFFARARREGRVILTSSPSLIHRSTCPPAFLVKPDNLHKGLIDIYREFQLELSVDKFLTVCGKCGGGIAELNSLAKAHAESAAYTDHSSTDGNAATPMPPLPPQWRERPLPTDRPVYYCVSCHQPYWWNEGESSSPAKAMKKAHLLYEVIKKGLQGDEGTSSAIAEVIGEEQTDGTGRSDDERISSELTSTPAELSAMFVNRDRIMASRERVKSSDISIDQSNPQPVEDAVGGGLASVFVHGEPVLTNWNGDFKGTLDYIFISPEWVVQDARVVPRVDVGYDAVSSMPPTADYDAVVDLGDEVIAQSQPSELWPSDHMLVVASLWLS